MKRNVNTPRGLLLLALVNAVSSGCGHHATRGAGGIGRVDVTWLQGREPRDCADANARFEQAQEPARTCDGDDECFNYPCTCSAIGSSDSAKDLLALTKWLDLHCGGASVVYAYCGETTPVCVHNRCEVRKEKSP